MLLSVLVAQFAVIGVIEAARDSVTIDEARYLASGVAALTDHEIGMNPHPLLSRLPAAAVALVARPVVPDDVWTDQPDDVAFSRAFVDANQAAGRLDAVVLAARLVALAQTAAAGLLITRLVRRLGGGARASLGAAAVWLTTPLSVGLGHLNITDTGFALAGLVVCDAMISDSRRRTDRSLLWLAISCGALILTRHTGLLVVVVAMAYAVYVRRGERDHMACAAMILALVTWGSVWVAYRAVDPLGPVDERRDTMQALVNGACQHGLTQRLVLAVPWPIEYRAGIANLAITQTPQPAYLLGHSWDGGRWWYWPGAVAVKVAAPTLAVGAFGLARALARRAGAVTVPLAVALALTAPIVASPRNGGARYLLGGLALAGVCAAVGLANVRARRGIAGVVGVLQIASLWSSVGHTLSWTPPPFRPGYDVTTDSNLDWGQDFDRLRTWAVGKQPYVAFFGAAGLDLADIPGARPLPPAGAGVHGWVAVSATLLTAYGRDDLAWLRAYEPVGTIGGSIVVYRLDAPVR